MKATLKNSLILEHVISVALTMKVLESIKVLPSTEFSCIFGVLLPLEQANSIWTMNAVKSKIFKTFSVAKRTLAALCGFSFFAMSK